MVQSSFVLCCPGTPVLEFLHAGPTEPNSLKAPAFCPDGFSSLDRKACGCVYMRVCKRACVEVAGMLNPGLFF